MPSSAARPWISERSGVDNLILTRLFLLRVARAYSRYRRNDASDVTVDFSFPASKGDRICLSSRSSALIAVPSLRTLHCITTGNNRFRKHVLGFLLMLSAVCSSGNSIETFSPRKYRKIDAVCHHAAARRLCCDGFKRDGLPWYSIVAVKRTPTKTVHPSFPCTSGCSYCSSCKAAASYRGTGTGSAGASHLPDVVPLRAVRTKQEASYNILNAGLSPHGVMVVASPHLSAG